MSKLFILSILGLSSFFLLSSSRAQVSIGYRNPVVASASMGNSSLQSIAQLNQFQVQGMNVEPGDGSTLFSRSTVWVVGKPDKQFSLAINDANPLAESTSVFALSQSASVSRTEILPVVVFGPAANALRSVFPRISGPLETDFVTPEARGF